MQCTECREHFTEYLEGNLAPAKREEIAGHLRACGDCAVEMEAFARTVTALREMPLADPPKGLRDRINRAIAAEKTTTPAFRISWQRVGALAAAATLLLGFWAVFSYQQLRPVSRVSPARQAQELPREAVKQTEELPAVAEKPAKLDTAKATEEETFGSVEKSVPTISSHAPQRLDKAPATEEASGPPMPGSPQPAAQVSSADTAQPAATDSGKAGEKPAAAELRRDVEAEVSDGLKTLGVGSGAGAAARVATVAGQAGVNIVITPPSLEKRIVGCPVEVEVTIETEADVKEAVVRAQPHTPLQLAENKPIIYQGPLQAQVSKRLTFGVIATESGTQTLDVNLSSELSGVAASTSVTIPDFRPPPQHLTTQVFQDIPLDRAVQAVADEAEVNVVVEEGIGQHQVTADFSEGVLAEAALRILADIAGGQLQAEGDSYHIRRPTPDDATE